MKSCEIKIIWKSDFWISMFESKDEELRGWKQVAFGIACQRWPCEDMVERLVMHHVVKE